jgi:16S rRNA (adenine1518-N6/adenine1519-N6)-dimethyltransferase
MDKVFHQAKKRFGQHFLKDNHIAERICNSLEGFGTLYNDVLEVGPGLGVLTEFLYPKYLEHLHLVEIDRDLVPGLRTNYPLIKDHIFEEDFLELRLDKVAHGQLAVIGNFPYNISSQILFKMVEYRATVPQMVGMFQREVAQRVAATPGNKVYGLLSAWVQCYFEIEYLFTVSEGSFSPPPKVKSAVIRLSRKEQEPDCNPKLLLQIIKAAFNQRRKTLRNALRNFEAQYDKIPDQGLLNRRAEELGYEEYIALAKLFG